MSLSIIIGISVIGFFAICFSDIAHAKKLDCLVSDNGVEVITKLSKVSAKRISVKGKYSETNYFVTFEILENKSRIEFEVSGESYGLLAEGDKGNLTYQGDKFIKLERVNVVKGAVRR